jgi:hypothetical protein
MSKSVWDHPKITSELIEKSMQRAREERSRALWEMLQNVFSKPESSAKGSRSTRTGTPADVVDFTLKPTLRMG